jgi:hypothetical protein
MPTGSACRGRCMNATRTMLAAVMRGTPVRLPENVDTTMTGLATILRQAPDRIDVEGLNREAGRLATAGDQDLEAVARQLKPQSFAALDAAEQKLQALEGRRQAIQREAEQIGIPDVIDIDTAAILNDIEEKLARPSLRRAVREQLEHERRQWLETLDVHGGLTEELARMRKEFFPEHGPALKQIAEEQKALERERDLGRQEVQREVDFLRGKLDQLKVERPEQLPEALGAPAGTDMAKALEAAEFNRNVRMAMATGPRGAETRAPTAGERAPTGAPKAGEAPRIAPEIEAAATAVMESKGSLGDFKAVVAKELKALDAELADAQAAMKCAGAANA